MSSLPDGLVDSEEDRLDDQLEHDPRFLRRLEESRRELSEGSGVRLEDVEDQPGVGRPARRAGFDEPGV
jgi:hypothetical protein